MIGDLAVTTPDGQPWQVRRRWIRRNHSPYVTSLGAWRKKKKEQAKKERPDFSDDSSSNDSDPDVDVSPGGGGGGFDIGDLDFGEILLPLVIVVAIVGVLVLFMWWLVFPLVFLAIDVLLLLILIGGGIATKVLFRRPWTIDASSTHATVRWTFDAVGWRTSKKLMSAVANALQSNADLEQAAKAAGALKVRSHDI